MLLFRRQGEIYVQCFAHVGILTLVLYEVHSIDSVCGLGLQLIRPLGLLLSGIELSVDADKQTELKLHAACSVVLLICLIYFLAWFSRWR